MDKNYILGVGVTNAKKDEILEYIVTSLGESDKKLSIFTPNPEIIMHANGDSKFKELVNSADLALADGVGVMWAGQLLGKPFRERITGVDFMLELCEVAAKKGLTVGLLGGGPKIAELTRECLLTLYPKLRVVFAEEEWPNNLSSRPSPAVAGRVEGSSSKDFGLREIPRFARNDKERQIDILFVAFGFPKQEKWVYENLPKIDVRVAMAVGGSFDYISGAVPRAPLFIRNLGLEWLFRLIREPRRLRRQLALPKFLLAVFRDMSKSR